jgi:multiple sugar transport system substrate-binding protein
MRRLQRGRAAVAATAATAVLALGACSSGEPGDDASSGPEYDPEAEVTISIGNLAPTENAESRQLLLDRIEQFEDDHPNITIEAEETVYSPETFNAMLVGGTLPTTLEIPFTEIGSLIERDQVADITPYVDESDFLGNIRPNVMETVQDGDGSVYGIPYQVYTMGLVYNRGLFEKAGLDPDAPPATWDEVREAAKAISDKTDAQGFQIMTAENTGGWTLSALSYAFGGEMETPDGGDTPAVYAETGATADALEYLRTLRWEDGSMGDNFLVNGDDQRNDFAAGKVGMIVNGADMYGDLVVNRGMNGEDYGAAGLPQGPGSLGTLAGGAISIVSGKATPNEAAAAVKWLEFAKFGQYVDEDAAVNFAKSRDADGLPVMPPLFPILGEEETAQYGEWIAPYVNVQPEQVAPYQETVEEIPLVPEPAVKAQELYAGLDPVVQAVLTREDADIDALLSEAQTSINDLIAAG